MSVKYSVIIPIYNAEATLRRCLDSITGQGFSDYEIIAVNDGSADLSGKILAEYAERFPKVRYIDKENGGVSSARNMGLDMACGEYILFVDSDDYVTDNFFSALERATADSPDYIQFFGSKGCDGSVRSFSGEAAVDWLAELNCTEYLNSPCSKAYRRSIIEENGIRFPHKLSIGEDKVFVFRYVLCAESFAECREAVYHFTVDNKNSLSRGRRENLDESLLLVHGLMFDALKNSRHAENKTLLAAVSYSFFRSAYTAIRELRKFDLTRGGRIKRAKEICRRYAEKDVYYKRNLKHALIALPVKNGWAGLIDLMLGFI